MKGKHDSHVQLIPVERVCQEKGPPSLLPKVGLGLGLALTHGKDFDYLLLLMLHRCTVAFSIIIFGKEAADKHHHSNQLP